MFVDSRGMRFAAWLTSAVLAAVLLTGNAALLAAQAAVFAVGAAAGPRWSPYGLLFRWLLAPRLGPVEPEPAAPPRFAQAVGLAFALIGTAGYLAGLPALGLVATAFALAAAFANAAFGFCVGCELYLLLRRLTAPPARPASPALSTSPTGETTKGAAA